MDIANITDINELKAMAYDRVVMVQQIQQDLQVINERIGQLQPAVEQNGPAPVKATAS
jgi:hypothetical protein